MKIPCKLVPHFSGFTFVMFYSSNCIKLPFLGSGKSFISSRHDRIWLSGSVSFLGKIVTYSSFVLIFLLVFLGTSGGGGRWSKLPWWNKIAPNDGTADIVETYYLKTNWCISTVVLWISSESRCWLAQLSFCIPAVRVVWCKPTLIHWPGPKRYCARKDCV